MGRIRHHAIHDDKYPDRITTICWPAEQETVDFVLSQPDDQDDWDGRSGWFWFRLSDNSLVLGLYPQGKTYIKILDDATNDPPAELLTSNMVDPRTIDRIVGHLNEISEEQ